VREHIALGKLLKSRRPPGLLGREIPLSLELSLRQRVLGWSRLGKRHPNERSCGW
jgi:hypothetical protein